MTPASERFLGVDSEDSVREDQVRTDRLKDEASYLIVSFRKPSKRSVTERNEEPRGFEPSRSVTGTVEVLPETELLLFELAALGQVFLIGEQVADPELREVVETPGGRLMGLLE